MKNQRSPLSRLEWDLLAASVRIQHRFLNDCWARMLKGYGAGSRAAKKAEQALRRFEAFRGALDSQCYKDLGPDVHVNFYSEKTVRP